MKLPNPKTEQYHLFWDEGISNPKKFKPGKFHKRYDRKRFYRNIFNDIDNEENNDIMNTKIKYTQYIPDDDFRVDFYEQLVKPTMSWRLESGLSKVEYIYAIIHDGEITFIDGDNEIVEIIPVDVIIEVGQYLNLIKI